MWWCLQGRCQWTETQVGLDYDTLVVMMIWLGLKPRWLLLLLLLLLLLVFPQGFDTLVSSPCSEIGEMSVLRGEYVSLCYLTTQARWMVLVIGCLGGGAFGCPWFVIARLAVGWFWSWSGLQLEGNVRNWLGWNPKVVYSYRLLNSTIAQSLQSWFNELALNLPWYYGSSDGKTYVGKGYVAYMSKVVQWQWRWWFFFFFFRGAESW